MADTDLLETASSNGATTGGDETSEASSGDEGETLTVPSIVAELTRRCILHEETPAPLVDALRRRLGTRRPNPKLVPRLARLLVLNALRVAPGKDRRVLQDTLVRGASRLGDQAEAFCEAVVALLEASQDQWTDPGRRTQALALGRDLVYSFLKTLTGAAATPAWLQGVVAIQAQLLERGFREAPVARGPGRSGDLRIVETTMVCRGDVEAAFVAWVEAHGESTAALALLAVLGRVAGDARGSPGDRPASWARVRPLLLRLYRDMAWSAQLPEPWQRDAFRPLLQDMDADTWAELVPVIETGTKKGPGPTAVALRHLLEAVPAERRGCMDTGSLASGANLAIVTRSLKSSADESRRAAGETLEVILSLADLETRASVGISLCDGLAGRDGPLPQWHQRLGLVDGIYAALAAAAEPSGAEGAPATINWSDPYRTALGERSADVLLTAYGKEAHDGTLARIVDAFGLAAGLARDWEPLGPALQTPLSDGDKALGLLTGLSKGVELLHSRGDPAVLAPLLKHAGAGLEHWVSEAESRSGAHRPGALALHVLCVADPISPARMDLLANPDAFVFGPGLKGPRGPGSLWLRQATHPAMLVASCRAVGHVLGAAGGESASAPSCLTISAGATPEILKLLQLPQPSPAVAHLVACATAGDAAVRGTARKTLEELHQRWPYDVLAPALVAAAWLAAVDASEYFAGPAYAAEAAAMDMEDEALALPQCVPQNFQRALEACLEVDADAGAGAVPPTRAGLFPALLLLGSHPVLTGRPLRGPRPGVRRSQEDADYVRHLMEALFLGSSDEADSVAGDAWERLLQPDVANLCAGALLGCFQSDDEARRGAARSSIAALARGAGAVDESDVGRLLHGVGFEVLAARLAPLLLQQLRESPALALTDAELFAFLHPAEAEAREAEAKSKAAAKAPAKAFTPASGKAATKAPAKSKAKAAAKKGKKGKGGAAKRKKGSGLDLDLPGAKPKSRPKPVAAAKKPRAAEPVLSATQQARRKVGRAKARTERILTCLDALLYGAPEEGHGLIPVLLPVLARLLGVEVLRDAVQETLCALATTSDVCALLPHLAPALAACLRLVFTGEDVASNGALLGGTLRQVAGLCVSDDVSGDLDFAFPFPTYLLLQPLLLSVVQPPRAGDAAGPRRSSAAKLADRKRRDFFAKHLVPLLRAHGEVHTTLELEAGAASGDLRVTCRERNVLLALRCVQRVHELGVLDALEGREDPVGLLLLVCGPDPPLTLPELDVLLGPEGLFHTSVVVRRAAAVTRPQPGGEDAERVLGLRARLWASCHDSDEGVKIASREAWEALDLPAGGTDCFGLGLGFHAPLMDVLRMKPEPHVQDAVAVALAAGLKSVIGADSLAAEVVLGATLALFRDHPPPKKRDPSEEVTMEELFGSPTLSREEAGRDRGKPFRACAAAAVGAFGRYRAFRPAATPGLGFADAKAEDSPVDQTEALLLKTIDFVILEGLQEEDPEVRWVMLKAGARLAKGFGRSHVMTLLDAVEVRLEALLGRAGPTGDEAVADNQREGSVILLGTAATFLDATAEDGKTKVVAIMDLLGATLATPSAAVQSSTADVIVPLVPKCTDTAHALLDTLLDTCLAVDEADRTKSKTGKRMSYGQRRGASVGLGALVKGLGIAAIQEHKVVERLEAAANAGMGAKEGTLLAIAALSDYLAILFEPFLHHLLPLLLRLFSDASDRVREAADAAARNVMMHLTSYGVKLLLPAALRALREPAWRVKQAAIGVLGAMSSCSPKQLSRFLPDIIPPLASTVGDAHQKVRGAGAKALEDMGEVMKNPEIRAISEMIFKALGNPTKGTGPALVCLLACEFKHAVDAASLAFCIPLLVRGLKTRGAEQKRHAASITGNLVAVLARPDDMLPYLGVLLDGLKMVLHDAMPDVRAVAARSMGAMIRGLGEHAIPDLVPWLLVSTRMGGSGATRAGSAEGLSETLLVLGTQRCNVVLEEMLADARNPAESVREGVLWLVCFLPPGLGSEFASRLETALPVILHGLTDESDAVRDVARKAGQVLVGSHGTKFCSLMLPPLQDGMLHDDWRMRQAALQLLGDLLCKIGGVRAVGLTEALADEAGAGAGEKAGVNTTADAANAAILDVLGRATRNSVLALLYMLRNDIEGVVRQMAVTVWKTIVPNMGRALREITGELIQHIVVSLSSASFDRRVLAGRSLGELVKKLGETVLPDVLPFLQAGLGAEDEGRRQGVCMGLAQVFEHASAEQVEEYTPILVPAVCGALCDPSPRVRDAAASAFGTLHRSVGAAALDAVVPSLVAALGDGDEDAEEGNAALDGLQSVIRLQPTDLLQHLMPQWTARPATATKLRALSAAARAAGDQIHFHLRKVVPFLVEALASGEEGLAAAATATARALAGSAEDVAMQWMAQELCEPLDDEEQPTHRAAGAVLVRVFFECSPANYEEQLPIYLKHLVPRLLDPDSDVLVAAHGALVALVAAVPEETLGAQVEFFRTTLSSEVSNAKMRPGGVGTDGVFLFPATNDVPKGFAPFLPIYVTALKSGTSAAREVAALGLADLIAMTSEKALKPFVAKLLGPLIRIGGSRLAPEVKKAIIAAQIQVLERGGVTVKTFAPQLQNLFTRAALDETSTSVRTAGARALKKLMRVSTRVPQVLQELGSAAGDSEVLPPVRASALHAIRGILRVAGANVGPAYLDNLSEAVLSSLHAGDDVVRQAGAKALGALGVFLDPPVLGSILFSTLLVREEGREGDALGLAAVLTDAFDPTVSALEATGEADPQDRLLTAVLGDLQSSHATLKAAGCRGWAALAAAGGNTGDTDLLDRLFARLDGVESLAGILRDRGDPELRSEGLDAVKAVGKAVSQPQRRELARLVGAVYDAARGTQTRTRGPAERAMVALVGSGAPVALDLGQVAAREGWMEESKATEMAEHARRIYGRMPPDSDDEGES